MISSQASTQPRAAKLFCVRRLIINADDFGLTAGVNRAIAEAHKSGVVTSATVMANGAAFTDATALAASLPGLSIGCHVVLVDGSPVSEASEVSTLLMPNGNGEFYPAIMKFGLQAMANRFDPAQLEAEIIAQVQRVQSAGIAVTHLDTHKHTHVFSRILRPLIRAARACGIRAVRNPFELRQLAQVRMRSMLWQRSLQARALCVFAHKFRSIVAENGMATPDGTIGIAATGALDEELFKCLVTDLPAGTWELVCHPGYNDDDLKRVRTRLRDSRETELHLLTSSSARQILENSGIQLISYADLQA